MGEGNTITIGLALALVGGLLTLWWRIEGKFAVEAAARTAIKDDLNTYKTYVAQNHVSAEALRSTEERLISAFDKITARMEQIVSRLDKLAIDMAAAGIRREQV